MSNTITIELSAEDRARLDNLSAGMLNIQTLLEVIYEQGKRPEMAPAETDELTEQLKAIVAGAKNTPGATEPSAPPVTHETEEQPTEPKETTPAAPTKAISHAELGAKVRAMMTTGGLKEGTKAIVRSYAQSVPGIPQDKVAECYERLVALEAQNGQS